VLIDLFLVILILLKNINMNIHSTEFIHDINNNRIAVDIDLVTLISKIWKENIQTYGCCQNLPLNCAVNKSLKLGEGFVWVGFKTRQDLIHFITKLKCDNIINQIISRFMEIMYISEKNYWVR